jgi:thioredoxin-dependent peroxiredoxin
MLFNKGLGAKNEIRVGEQSPNFKLINEKGESWNLSDQAGNVTVLIFYPKNETLVCTRQLCSVRDHWEQYLETKAVVVGISPATPEEHNEFGKKYRLPLTLLSDSNREVTQIFSRHRLFPVQLLRSIIVIDAKGIIRSRTTMLRVFRPLDSDVIRVIHAARSDAFLEKYNNLRKSFWKERTL